MKETNSTNSIQSTQTNPSQPSLYTRAKEQETKVIELINVKNIERAEKLFNKEYYIFSQEFLDHIEKIYLSSEYICKKLYKSFDRSHRAELVSNCFDKGIEGAMIRIISEVNNTYTDFNSLPDSVINNFSEIFLNIEDYKNSIIGQALTANKYFKEDMNKTIQPVTVSSYYLKSQENYKIKKIFLNCINTIGVHKIIPLNSEDYHMLNISTDINTRNRGTMFSNTVLETYLLRKLLGSTDVANTKETKELYDMFFALSNTQEEILDKAIYLLHEIDIELKLLNEVKTFIDKFTPQVKRSINQIKEKSDTDTSRICATSSTGSVVTSFEPYCCGYGYASSIITSTITSTTTYATTYPTH